MKYLLSRCVQHVSKSTTAARSHLFLTSSNGSCTNNTVTTMRPLYTLFHHSHVSTIGRNIMSVKNSTYKTTTAVPKSNLYYLWNVSNRATVATTTNKTMMTSGITATSKSIRKRCTSHYYERVLTTSITKRYPSTNIYRHTTSQSLLDGIGYTIPVSSLIRSNLTIRSPYAMLSVMTHYYSSNDGGSGGPSRFPQVNRPPPIRPSSSSSSNRWVRGIGVVGAASVLFGKTKYVLAAMKLTKLASLGSMILSIGAYSMLFGWPYAVGIVGLIFCHECGHLYMMVQRGIPFSPMVFIPFGMFIYVYMQF
jgi:hypothetical protein